jgi:hypothetical protein
MPRLMRQCVAVLSGVQMNGVIVRICLSAVACAGIVAGLQIAVGYLTKLTARKGWPHIADSAARRAWSGLVASLIATTGAVRLLGAGVENDTIQWVADVAAFLITGFAIALWLTCRVRGERDSRDHGNSQPTPRRRG